VAMSQGIGSIMGQLLKLALPGLLRGKPSRGYESQYPFRWEA